MSSWGASGGGKFKTSNGRNNEKTIGLIISTEIIEAVLGKSGTFAAVLLLLTGQTLR